MKKLLISSIFVFYFLFSSGQSWYWGEAGYSNGNFSAPFVQFAVATDSSHNAYITGSYNNTIKFGALLLSAIGGINTYLVKYDSAGNVLWAVQPIDTNINSDCCSLSVATDKFGNIFVTGHFNGIIRFSSYKLTGGGAFIVKYSPSGNVLWAKQSVAGYAPISYAVAADDSGNAYITGFFDGKVSFGNDTINNPFQSYDMFLVKYDSAGNVLWAKQGNVPSSASEGFGYSLVADKDGNTYMAGQFIDTISLGATTLLSPKTAASFIAKYSPAGNILWAKQSTNSTINSYSWPSSIILNNTNNLYITGFFVDAVKFGSQSLYSASTNSTFLAKYDTGGDFVWAEQSSVGWYGGFLASDNMNHVYLTGETDNNPDTVKFGGYQLYTNPTVSLASFIIKFDSSGKALCGNLLNDVYAQGLASDPAGNYIYTTGTFYDTLRVGIDTLFGNVSDVDIFTGRWQNCPVDAGINTIICPNALVSLYPNPNTGKFTIQVTDKESGLKNIEVYNVLGERVFRGTIPSNQISNLIDLGSQPNGVYLYRVIAENGNLLGEGKIVIEK